MKTVVRKNKIGAVMIRNYYHEPVFELKFSNSYGVTVRVGQETSDIRVVMAYNNQVTPVVGITDRYGVARFDNVENLTRLLEKCSALPDIDIMRREQ